MFWSVVPGATRYAVYYETPTNPYPPPSPEFVCVEVDENTPQTIGSYVSTTVDSLVGRQEYSFRVRGYVPDSDPADADCGEGFASGLSDVATAMPLAPLVPEPGNLRVSVTHDSATLTWDSVTDATEYKVREGTTGGGARPVPSVGARCRS